MTLSGPGFDDGRNPWLLPLGILLASLAAAAGLATICHDAIFVKGKDPVWSGVLAIGALAVAFLAFQSLRKRLRSDPPELTLTPEGLRPGGEFRAVYRQHFRKDSLVRRASLRLVFLESASRGSGRSRRTFSAETVHRTVEKTDAGILADQDLTLGLEFTMPADAMHTFAGRNNQLGWMVQADVEVAGVPSETKRKSLDVRPEPPS